MLSREHLRNNTFSDNVWKFSFSLTPSNPHILLAGVQQNTTDPDHYWW